MFVVAAVGTTLDQVPWWGWLLTGWLAAAAALGFGVARLIRWRDEQNGEEAEPGGLIPCPDIDDDEVQR